MPISLHGHKGKNRSEGGAGKPGFTTQAKFSRYSVLLSKISKGNILSLKGSIPLFSTGDNFSR